MASSAIEKLVALLQKNPTLVTQLTQIGNIDEAVKLVKEKGLEIAKAELQEYMVKNLLNKASSGDMLKNLAGAAASGAAGDLLNGAAGSLLGGLLGGKKK